jgi:hypothetical protein
MLYYRNFFWAFITKDLTATQRTHLCILSVDLWDISHPATQSIHRNIITILVLPVGSLIAGTLHLGFAVRWNNIIILARKLEFKMCLLYIVYNKSDYYRKKRNILYKEQFISLGTYLGGCQGDNLEQKMFVNSCLVHQHFRGTPNLEFLVVILYMIMQWILHICQHGAHIACAYYWHQFQWQSNDNRRKYLPTQCLSICISCVAFLMEILQLDWRNTSICIKIWGNLMWFCNTTVYGKLVQSQYQYTLAMADTMNRIKRKCYMLYMLIHQLATTRSKLKQDALRVHSKQLYPFHV